MRHKLPEMTTDLLVPVSQFAAGPATFSLRHTDLTQTFIGIYVGKTSMKCYIVSSLLGCFGELKTDLTAKDKDLQMSLNVLYWNKITTLQKKKNSLPFPPLCTKGSQGKFAYVTVTDNG